MKNKSRGQSIVELTVLLPLLLVILYIPADFGISLLTAHLTQNAVREGARFASTLPACGSAPCVTSVGPVSCPGSDQVVVQTCARLPDFLLANPTVTVQLEGTASSTCMRRVSVSVSGTYDLFLYHIMNLVVPGSVTDTALNITRATQMRYEIQNNENVGPC
jgi:hypothetical protein